MEAQHVEREGLRDVPPVSPRAVIAEDEPELAGELREQLGRLWPALEICAVVGDGIEALKALESQAPDVLFLDIQLPGASGVDVAKFAAGKCHVVFVTAFDEYAIEAFDRGAIDYVVKPVNPTRLFETVRRLQDRLSRQSPPATRSGPVRSGDEEARYLRWINASRGTEICVVTVDEVCYFKAEDKYTIAVMESEEALIRRPLKDLAAALDPSIFWQIHRSTVVNATAIAGVNRDFRGHLLVRLKRRPERLAVAESCNHLFKT
jgi:DNA-binding LytR/AlgR family response regulator